LIISASRRTDIPAYYSDWFINRLKDEYFIVPHPRNNKLCFKIKIDKSNLDCIVFWTKNPIPILSKLDVIDDLGYKYYFQFSLTPYSKLIETNLPSKRDLYKGFIHLSNKLGKDFVIWRYDPIIIDDNHTIKWHLIQFENMCSKLSEYTSRCVISFIDINKNIKSLYQEISLNDKTTIAKEFLKIASKYKMQLYACSEDVCLEQYGISKRSCIDKEIVDKLLGESIRVDQEKNQRKYCRCIESIDIGTYNTCDNGCTYCYAVLNRNEVKKVISNHDCNNAMINNKINNDVVIKEKSKPSIIDKQLKLF
jgi:DNA repair photolyase